MPDPAEADGPSGSGRFGTGPTVVLVVGLLATLTWLHVDAWAAWSDRRAVEDAGVVQVGEVADLRTSPGPDGAATHHVEVVLPDGGTATDAVDEGTWTRLEVGDPVRVGVDPVTGAGVVLGDDDPGRTVLLLTIVDLVLLALVGRAAARHLRGPATPPR